MRNTTDFPNETPDTILDELIDDQRDKTDDRYKADVVHFVGAKPIFVALRTKRQTLIRLTTE